MKNNSISRRNLLNGLFGNMMEYVLDTANTSLSTSSYLRPPGAMPEKLFLSSCNRCGNCVTACPNECIYLLSETTGINFGTPAMNYTDKSCNFCKNCIDACPTEALSNDFVDKPIGTAVIRKNMCLISTGVICSQNCLYSCSTYNAISSEGYNVIPKIDSSCCMGCGKCMHNCIANPSAIKITPSS